MLKIPAKLRSEKGKKEVRSLRKKGFIPAVLYGPKTENLLLKLERKDFEKVYKEVGHSALISLEIEGKENPYLVLVRDVARDSVTDQIIHIDFYQPDLEKKVEASIPIVLQGTAPAVKELGGSLVQMISEVEIRTLPQNLPHEVYADISKLATFDDVILIKDLVIPEGVEILRSSEDIVAKVVPPTNVEEELATSIEEKPEEIEVVGKKEKEEATKEEQQTS